MRLGVCVVAVVFGGYAVACGNTQKSLNSRREPPIAGQDSGAGGMSGGAGGHPTTGEGGSEHGAAGSGEGGAEAIGGAGGSGTVAAGEGGAGAGGNGAAAADAGGGAGGSDGGAGAAGRSRDFDTGGAPVLPGPVVLDGRMPDEAYPQPETVAWPVQHDDCDLPEAPGQARQLGTLSGAYGDSHVLATESFLYFLDEQLCRPGRWFQRYVDPECELFGPLLRMPRCGGAQETVIDDVAEPRKLVAGGGYVYMLGAKLQRVRESDASVAEFDSGSMCFSDVAADDTHVYVYDRCEGRIARAPHGGQDLETLIRLTDSTTIASQLALRGSVTYFGCAREICWHDRRDDSRGKLPFKALWMIFDLAVIDGALFVTHGSTVASTPETEAHLTRLPLDHSAPSEFGPVPWLYELSLSTTSMRRLLFHDLVVANDRVYASVLNGAGESQISEIGATGEPNAVLPAGNVALSIYDHRLYWSAIRGIYTARPLAPRVHVPARALTRGWASWGADEFSAFAVGPQGEVVAWRPEGGAGNTGPRPVFLEGFDAQGKLVWSHEIATTLSTDGGPGCVAIDASGIITATLTLNNTFPGLRMLRLRFAADGRELARVEEDGKVGCVADGGSVWLSGFARLEKRDSTGALEWSTPSWLTSLDSEYVNVSVRSVGQDGALAFLQASGEFTLNGEMFDTSPYETGRLLAIDRSGQLRWVTRIEGAEPMDVEQLPDGRTVVLAQQTFEAATKISGQSIAALRPSTGNTLLAWLDSHGVLQKSRIYDTPPAAQLGVRSNGHLIVLTNVPERPLRLVPSDRPGADLKSIALIELDSEGELIEAFDVNATEPLFVAGDASLIGLQSPELRVRDDRVWLSGMPIELSGDAITIQLHNELFSRGAILMQLRLP